MPATERDPNFPTTHWTLVQIVKGNDKKQAAVALEEICERYWYPVYAYLRRSGYASHDAEDFTQALFEKLVADEALHQVRQERGRLRAFLIGSLRRVISKQDRHERARKRGGGLAHVSLHEKTADGRYAREPANLQDPEMLYDRAWAMQLLENVRVMLRDSFARNGREADFEVLEPHLGWDDSSAPTAEIAAKLGSNESTVRVLIHRLRKKFRDLLDRKVSKTVINPEDIAAEMDWMREVLRR